MDEKFFLSYKYISRIIHPEALTHYLSILRRIISEDCIDQSERIIFVDKTVTGHTLKGFTDLLGVAFGSQKINKKVSYINLNDVNVSIKLSFDDSITYLGSLSLSRPLSRLLDEAPLEECLFYYYPPVLWGKHLSKFLPAYDNDRSKMILSNLIAYVSKETNTALGKNFIFDCIMDEVRIFNSHYSECSA